MNKTQEESTLWINMKLTKERINRDLDILVNFGNDFELKIDIYYFVILYIKIDWY